MCGVKLFLRVRSSSRRAGNFSPTSTTPPLCLLPPKLTRRGECTPVSSDFIEIFPVFIARIFKRWLLSFTAPHAPCASLSSPSVLVLAGPNTSNNAMGPRQKSTRLPKPAEVNIGTEGDCHIRPDHVFHVC